MKIMRDSNNRRVLVFNENPKLEALHKVVLGKSNFLLWCLYDFEQDNLLQGFKDKCRLCKLQSDSRGLNLQAYDFAVYYTMPLSGGMFFQSQDRLYRMGRTKDVLSIVLIPNGEFGTRLLQMLDRKQKLTKKFISELLKCRL